MCAKCVDDEEADYEAVRAYLEEHPSRSAAAVARATDVAESCVLRFVAEGRIKNVTTREAIKCGRCGAPAISTSKRLCEGCLNKLNQQLAAEQASVRLPPKQDASGKPKPAAGSEGGMGSAPGRLRDVIDTKRRLR